MKFIGQYIQSFIARFRSDVYLEDIDTGTIASGGNLGLDSNNKIVKAAESSGGISHDGSTANGVLTFKDADEATVEANLTFDGADALISSTGKLSFRDANSYINSPTANDLEIVATDIVLDAGASIELDAVSAITLKVGDDEFLDIKNVNNTFARFDAESGANTSFTLYEQGGDSLVDYCTLTVGEHGATMISTIDQAAAQAHFEIAADGDITLDAAGQIKLEPVAGNNILLDGTVTVDGGAVGGLASLTSSADLSIVATGNEITVDTDNFTIESATSIRPSFILKATANSNKPANLFFVKDRGAAGASGDYVGETFYVSDNDAQEQITMVSVAGKVADATDGAEEGEYIISIKNTSNAVILRESLKLTGNGGVTDVTLGYGATSRTIIAGTLVTGSTDAINNSGVIQVAAQTIIDHNQLANYAATEHFTQANITTVGTITTGEWRGTDINGAYIGDDQINSQHYADGSIDTAHIADDQVTFAKAQGVTPNVFGNVIKLIPSDFMANDDGGNQKFGVGYVDHAGSTTYGMRTANNATELFAFVSIPQGMTATHVDIFDKNDLAVEVFEVQINATTMVSKGSGNANTTIDITDVASTATNFLAIKVTTTSATNDLVHGGTVTIA
tara:strand:+ start:1752 stop:3620 length:1869 start_codon:yes stop_codon:yes gene_type:complete